MPEVEHHSAWITRDGALQDSGSGGRLFPYWSFTKSVIAALALFLEDEGKLDLAAPLGRPELPPRLQPASPARSQRGAARLRHARGLSRGCDRR